MMRNSLFLALLVLMVGCGSNVGLTGKVVFSDDKSPVPTGTICFQAGAFMARGVIQSDGTFVVGSLKQKDGLPPGMYTIYFVDVHKEIGTDGGGTPIVEPLIDARYASPSTSGVTFDVTSSTKNAAFEVDRAPARKR